MDSETTKVVNCFPSIQCLSGNIPDECKTGNTVCPTLPRTPPDSRVRFPPTPGTVHTVAISSSDSDTSADDKASATTSTVSTTSSSISTTSSSISTTPTVTTTSPVPPNPARPTRPHRRIPHTIIERRYRDNLNMQIETLRLCLPTLKNAYVCSPDVEDAALPPRLPSKAMIIATAATYIKELEADRNGAIEAVNHLQQQVDDLQKLISCNDCSILQYLQAVGGQQSPGPGQAGGIAG